jgi:hypothetical protein
MADLVNLERLPVAVRELVTPYAKEMLELLGENIKSIVVFGSAIGRDFVPKKSNVNLLIVCESVGITDLRKSLKLVAQGRKKGIVAPLFLTETHMKTSSDVFPIEFLDMRDFHVVIYGTEVFDSLDIHTENLRLECEEQLKGKLIRLRQAYLEIGTNPKLMESVLVESLTSLIPVFRSILRLKNEMPPMEKEGVIEAVANGFPVEKSPLIEILAAKRGRTKISKDLLEGLFGRYVVELEKLAIAVDRLKSEPGEGR